METIYLACCFIGIALFILSIILCVFTRFVWIVPLVLGEIIAFCGYAPILSKLF